MDQLPSLSSQADVKRVFMQCLDVAEIAKQRKVLSEVDPEIANQVRELLESMNKADVVDKVFEMTGENRSVNLDATADSHDGPSADNDYEIAGAVAEGPGTQIGNYKLLEQIGEGGMGSVFMAQQTEPVKRKVAIKIVKPGMDSRQVIARFEAERQALALMDHPNISRVFDGGTTDAGRPYFVMELVKGIPLTDFCERKKLCLRDRLVLFVDLCRGVQHAHQRGVIHRDLKPSNVLVTLHDDKPVVKIIDFGIAKAMNQELTDKTLFTQFASMIGTPLYMSPEQAELSGLDVDTRSDVYSLGVMLYELLTGTTPFDRATLNSRGIDEIRRMIRETEPPRPSQRISTVKASDGETIEIERLREIKRSKSTLSGELDWIAMRALEKDRERRYKSASDFADDVQRHLDGEAVQACPPSISYRLQKLSGRHRGLLASLSAVFLSVCIGMATSLFYAWEAKQSAIAANSSAREADRESRRAMELAKQRDDAANLAESEAERFRLLSQREQKLRVAKERDLYVSNIRVAASELSVGQDAAGLTNLLDHVPQGSQTDNRGWEWYYLLGQTRTPAKSWTAQKQGRNIDWSADGKIIMTRGGSRTKLWDADTLALKRELPVGRRFGERGKWVLAPLGRDVSSTGGRKTGVAVAHNPQEDLTQTIVIENSHQLWATPCVSSDGMRIAINHEATRDGGFKISTLRLADGKWEPDNEYLSADGYMSGWNFNDDLFALASTNLVRFFDGTDFSLRFSIPCPDIRGDSSNRGGPWHPLANLLVLRRPNKDGVLVIDADTRQIVENLEVGDPLICYEWSPDGSWLAAGGKSGSLYFWDTNSWELKHQFMAHRKVVLDLAWNPDSTMVASIGTHGDAAVWTLEKPLEPVQTEGNASFHDFPFFWLDQRRLCFMSDARTFQIWDSAEDQIESVIDLPEPGPWKLLSARRAVQWIEDKETWETFDTETGNVQNIIDNVPELSQFKIGIDENDEFLAVSACGPHRQTGFLAKPFVIDLALGSSVSMDIPYLAECMGLAWSRDSKSIAVAGGVDQGTRTPYLRVFDAADGRSIHQVKIGDYSSGFFTSASAWSPTGEFIAVANNDGYCEVVHLRRNHEYAVAAGRMHTGHVTSMAWHPNGKRVASGGVNRIARVWDSNTGQVLLSMEMDAAVLRVAWSPDGTRLAAGDRDGNLRVWSTKSGSEISGTPAFRHLRLRQLADVASHRLKVAQKMGLNKEFQAAMEILEPHAEHESSGTEHELLDSKLRFASSLYHYYRSITAENLGDWDTVVEAITRASQIEPKMLSVVDRMVELDARGVDVPIRNTLSNYVRLSMEEIEELEHNYRQVDSRWYFKRDNAGRLASECNNLASFLNANGLDLQMATTLSRRAVELVPTNGEYLNSLALTCFRDGDREKALQLQRRVVELLPEWEPGLTALKDYQQSVADRQATTKQ